MIKRFLFTSTAFVVVFTSFSLGQNTTPNNAELRQRRNAIESELESVAVIDRKVAEGKDGYGFNAATEKFEDLIAAGVIDPAKVTRTALQNAASIAGLMLTTEAMIAELPDEKGEGGGMPGGMGGMGMGM